MLTVHKFQYWRCVWLVEGRPPCTVWGFTTQQAGPRSVWVFSSTWKEAVGPSPALSGYLVAFAASLLTMCLLLLLAVMLYLFTKCLSFVTPPQATEVNHWHLAAAW